MAKDTWPGGYQVTTTKSVSQRIANCNTFLEKWTSFADVLDGCFVDNIGNTFSKAACAWPEAYIITDQKGNAEWFINALELDGSEMLKKDIYKELDDYCESKGYNHYY